MSAPGPPPADDARLRHVIADHGHAAIINGVKQLITRIDERLHRRLKDRAAIQGRSMNAVVTDLLEKGLSADDERARFRARVKEMGLLYEPPEPKGTVPTHEELLARIPRDVRREIIKQFDEDRKHR